MMPARETSPTVGLIPYSAARLPGQIIEPSVSVPSATGPNPALTPTALPELLPHGSPPAGNLPSMHVHYMVFRKMTLQQRTEIAFAHHERTSQTYY
jgi:hypothetical protein